MVRLLLILAAFLSLFGLHRKQPAAPPVSSAEAVEFESLCLRENGMAAVTDLLQAQRTETGVRLVWGYEYFDDKPLHIIREVEGDEALYREICRKLGEWNIPAWNGFDGPNPPHVLDGSSMSFEAVLSDGTRLHASGSNNFPRNYNRFHNYLMDMLRTAPLQERCFQAHGFELTLPEDWLGRVTAAYGFDYTVFELEGDPTVYLIRVDEEYARPEESGTDLYLGHLRKTDGTEECYLSLHVYNSYMKESDTAEYRIYRSLSAVLPGIRDSIRALPGYELTAD